MPTDGTPSLEIGAILIAMLWTAVRLRSFPSMAVWFFALLAFVMTQTVGINIVYFWLMVILTALSLAMTIAAITLFDD